MRKKGTGKYGRAKFGRAPRIKPKSFLVACEKLWTISKGKLKLGCSINPTRRAWWSFSEKESIGK